MSLIDLDSNGTVSSFHTAPDNEVNTEAKDDTCSKNYGEGFCCFLHLSELQFVLMKLCFQVILHKAM